MKQLLTLKSISALIALIGLISLPVFSGCEGGGDSHDFGDNDPNLVACIGDSITQGYRCIGAPYPARLSVLSGKATLNYGVGGTDSSYGVSVISSALSRKPGYVCILFGSNDAIHGDDPANTKENLRAIIAACKANNSVPIIGTPPKMIAGHKIFDGTAFRMAEAIRELASEENVALVDLYKAFGEGVEYLNPDDGLHLSDAGGDLVAQKFNSKL